MAAGRVSFTDEEAQGPTPRRALCLLSCPTIAVLEVLRIFQQEALPFHFALSPANGVASAGS